MDRNLWLVKNGDILLLSKSTPAYVGVIVFTWDSIRIHTHKSRRERRLAVETINLYRPWQGWETSGGRRGGPRMSSTQHLLYISLYCFFCYSRWLVLFAIFFIILSEWINAMKNIFFSRQNLFKNSKHGW
jgi:hypothetical protein